MEEKLKELFFSEGFASYVKLQVEVGASFAAEIWKKDVSPDYIKGAMAMLKQIMRIPASKATAPEDKAALAGLEAAVRKNIEVRFYGEMMNE